VLSFWKRASHVRLRPTLHLHYYLSLAPLAGHSACPQLGGALPLAPKELHSNKLHTRPVCLVYTRAPINSSLRSPAAGTTTTATPSGTINVPGRHHPPSAKTTASTLVSATRTVHCSRLITTRPPLQPTSRPANEPSPTGPLLPGVTFCPIGIAGPHPRRLFSIPLRVKARTRRPRHPGRGRVPVDLLLDHAISTGTSSAHAALHCLGPALQSALFPLRILLPHHRYPSPGPTTFFYIQLDACAGP
jgi:hypothetical protein